MAAMPPPSAPVQVPQGYELKKKGHFWRNAGIGCGGLIALIIIVVILVPKGSSTSVNGGTPGSGQTTSCSPKPCANADGFTVSITGLNRNLPPGQFDTPEAGNHFVAMQVTLKNGSSDQKNANPFDFKLKDVQGQKHDITFNTDPACGIWQSVQLDKGASLGPKALCFQAAGDPAGPLTLIWSPGFFSSDVNIPLQ